MLCTGQLPSILFDCLQDKQCAQAIVSSLCLLKCIPATFATWLCKEPCLRTPCAAPAFDIAQREAFSKEMRVNTERKWYVADKRDPCFFMEAYKQRLVTHVRTKLDLIQPQEVSTWPRPATISFLYTHLPHLAKRNMPPWAFQKTLRLICCFAHHLRKKITI